MRTTEFRVPCPIPTNCNEAADRFEAWADRAGHGTQQGKECLVYAKILRAFGNQPIPAVVLDEWDFSRR